MKEFAFLLCFVFVQTIKCCNLLILVLFERTRLVGGGGVSELGCVFAQAGARDRLPVCGIQSLVQSSLYLFGPVA